MKRKTLQKYFTIWLAGFVLLFVASFPMQYKYLRFNMLVSTFEHVTKTIAPSFFDNPRAYTFDYVSDSTGLYLNLILVSVLALLLTIVVKGIEVMVKKELSQKTAWTIVYTLLVYYLALQMFLYGFNKLFKFQFYDAHPNTLFTPVGYLTKDFLFWTSMGSSHLYSIGTGAVEVLVGVLLLFGRTRNFAIVLGLLVSVYLVLINFAFDINVKIQSLSLFLFFVILLWPNLKDYYAFFKQLPSQKITLLPLLKVVIVILIIGEALYPYLSSGSFNGDHATKPPHYGAYAITNDSVYKRFFIHSDPYFIIQYQDDHLYSFPMTFTPNHIQLKGPNGELAQLAYSMQDSIFSISGDFFGHPMQLQATKINIDSLPLYEDTYQWTIDGYGK